MSSPVDHVLDELKMQNHEWVKEVITQDPNFFKNSAKSQQPKVIVHEAVVAKNRTHISLRYPRTGALDRLLRLQGPGVRLAEVYARRHFHAPQHREVSLGPRTVNASGQSDGLNFTQPDIRERRERGLSYHLRAPRARSRAYRHRWPQQLRRRRGVHRPAPDRRGEGMLLRAEAERGVASASAD